MFTGIIEETGTVRRISSGAAYGAIEIAARTVLEGTKLGDSIAVNGVCLTVTGLPEGGFTADVMAETMRRTALGQLKSGSRVNLERAMAADGRFGGHIMSGHIDGVGHIRETRREGNAVWVTVAAPGAILRGIVPKGSIGIDGVSLTAAALDAASFSVSVIPHTGAQTILLDKRPGDPVNLENDIVGKYVRRLLSPAPSGTPEGNGITLDFLAKHGF